MGLEASMWPISDFSNCLLLKIIASTQQRWKKSFRRDFWQFYKKQCKSCLLASVHLRSWKWKFKNHVISYKTEPNKKEKNKKTWTSSSLRTSGMNCASFQRKIHLITKMLLSFWKEKQNYSKQGKIKELGNQNLRKANKFFHLLLKTFRYWHTKDNAHIIQNCSKFSAVLV